MLRTRTTGTGAEMPEYEKCGRGYADGTHSCEKPRGHREDSENVYSDPDGAHYSRGLWWTNKWSTNHTNRSQA